MFDCMPTHLKLYAILGLPNSITLPISIHDSFQRGNCIIYLTSLHIPAVVPKRKDLRGPPLASCREEKPCFDISG